MRSCHPRRHAYTHGSGEQDDPGQFQVTVIFAEQEGKTRLTLRSLFASAEERDKVVEFGAIEGGSETLDRLAEYLRKESKSMTSKQRPRRHNVHETLRQRNRHVARF